MCVWGGKISVLFIITNQLKNRLILSYILNKKKLKRKKKKKVRKKENVK